MTIDAWITQFGAELDREVAANNLAASSAAVYRSAARKLLPRLGIGADAVDRGQLVAALMRFKEGAIAGKIQATSSEVTLASTIATRLMR